MGLSYLDIGPNLGSRNRLLRHVLEGGHVQPLLMRHCAILLSFVLLEGKATGKVPWFFFFVDGILGGGVWFGIGNGLIYGIGIGIG